MLHKIKNWKPVDIDTNVLSSTLDGLIGIEECTDYNLDDFVSTKKLSKKRKKNKEANNNAKKVKTEGKSVVSGEVNLSPSKNGNTSSLTEGIEDVGMEAWSQFGLPKCIIHALADQKFVEPTAIQSLTLPAAIFGRKNILGAAETGSGKTLAFGLPILTGILKIKEKELNDAQLDNSQSHDYHVKEYNLNEDGLGCVRSINNIQIESVKEKKPLYGLILTPTRELAIQIKNHLVKAAKYTGINVAVVVGGMAAVKQERILGKCPEIVVATPGRLWELIQQGNPHLSQVDNIRFLAIDETDRMLERGHFQELHDLIERINLDDHKKKKRQNFIFSATLTLVHDIPKHLLNKSKVKRSIKITEMTATQKLLKIVNSLGIEDPKVVDITKGTGTSGTLTECRITCNIDEKDFYVYYFLQKHPGRTLIFCNSIGCVKRLAHLLNLLNCNAMPLHASMQQRQRLKNLERFTEDENGILIATDVAARGLDIPNVEHVLHYQTPRTSESYVHRSGRTARASKEGLTILLIEPAELSNYMKICKTLSKSEDLPIFPVQENYLNAVKLRVNTARELDKLELQVKKANSENGWLQKAAEEMDIIVDDVAKRYNSKETQKTKKIAEAKRKHLQKLLSKPIFPKGFSSKYPLSSGQLDIPMMQGLQKNNKAVDIMKTAIANNAKIKSKNLRLYKPKQKHLPKQETFSKLPKNVMLEKAKKQNRKGF